MHRYTLGFTAITGGIIFLAIFSRVKPRKCSTYYPSSKRCIPQIMCTKRQVFRCWKGMCTKRQVFRCWKGMCTKRQVFRYWKDMCTKRQVFRCWKDMCTKRQVFRCWKIFTAMNNLALHADYVILI